MAEITGTQSLRVASTWGGLPGWWLGEADGRRLSPLINTMDWDVRLSQTGFSGVDTVVHDLPDESKHCTSCIVSQAVDDTLLNLRDPLSYVAELPPPTERLLLVGG